MARDQAVWGHVRRPVVRSFLAALLAAAVLVSPFGPVDTAKAHATSCCLHTECYDGANVWLFTGHKYWQPTYDEYAYYAYFPGFGFNLDHYDYNWCGH